MASEDDKTRIGSGGIHAGPGTQLSGTYELDERIAFGGMGEVWRGHNIQTGDHVAIKIVLPELARDQTVLSLFRKEASILNHLSHDAIVRYHVFTVDPGIARPYLAMEYVDGESLFDIMRRGPMPVHDVYRLCHRLASGLAAVHKAGAIHRDLSPDNVILPGGQVDRAKIIDFGIARSVSFGGETLIGDKFAGKYGYVSPEQLGLYGGDVTDRSDIYSLGLVLAAALRGRPLDMSGSQLDVVLKRQAVPDLSEIDESIRSIIEAMLQPDPQERPASMAEIARLTRFDLPEEVEESVAPRVAALRERLAHARSTPPLGSSGASSPTNHTGPAPPPAFVPHEPPRHLSQPHAVVAPAAPPPPTPTPTPEPPPRKRALALIVVAALILVSGGAFLLFAPASQNEAGNGGVQQAVTPNSSEPSNQSSSPPQSDQTAKNDCMLYRLGLLRTDQIASKKAALDLCPNRPMEKPAVAAAQLGPAKVAADGQNAVDAPPPALVKTDPALPRLGANTNSSTGSGATATGNAAADSATREAGASQKPPIGNPIGAKPPGDNPANGGTASSQATVPRSSPTASDDGQRAAAEAPEPAGSSHRPGDQSAAATVKPGESAPKTGETDRSGASRPSTPILASNNLNGTEVAMTLPTPAVPQQPELAPVPLDTPAQWVRWLDGYDGGDCFYAKAAEATGRTISIEGFGSAQRQFETMRVSFQTRFHLEPTVSMGLIEPSQCEVAKFLRALGESDVEQPKLVLDAMSVTDGGLVSGSLETYGGLISNVMLIDHKGMAINLDDRISVQYGRANFSIPMGLNAADKAAGKPVPLVMLVITGRQAIHAADFSTPQPATVALSQILNEIRGKESQFSATAKYFRLGG
ncbi:protein kinase [Mesorhizobium sp. BR1-1-16]|uniref:serine/threonine-protein kinase n=1 Tax=Mesorhizobium sp. BR1-1-16 TaxID=2876653 RepID=UPI001CCD65AC|nr:serine/threonine protein kinase [Mesorhizobium sp. BR1-1-16]MBZ9938984.1 protein kinase [Mesorhizobium sp. BR1-1-16]